MARGPRGSSGTGKGPGHLSLSTQAGGPMTAGPGPPSPGLLGPAASARAGARAGPAAATAATTTGRAWPR